MFHGLEGCSRSHYAVSLMNQLRGEGWCGVVLHFRGCGGEINRLPRGYHAGDSAEVDWILRRLKKEKLRGRLHVVGISMGGNDLLKWLGQQGDHALDVVHRAVAVSAPLDLQTAAKQLDHGWNKLIYTQDFLRTMKPKVLKKVAAHGLDLNPRAIRVTSTFREIDNLYTAPIHGFSFARAASPGFGTSKSRPF
jgi:predicted alpha/beta-fold hydrolase